jgi:endoglucanase Acf2
MFRILGVLPRDRDPDCHRAAYVAGTDHHFHYGYWVAAAAAVASQDLPWYRAHLEPAVKALVRDYANNDNSDPVFPFARHKDW